MSFKRYQEQTDIYAGYPTMESCFEAARKLRESKPWAAVQIDTIGLVAPGNFAVAVTIGQKELAT